MFFQISDNMAMMHMRNFKTYSLSSSLSSLSLLNVAGKPRTFFTSWTLPALPLPQIMVQLCMNFLQACGIHQNNEGLTILERLMRLQFNRGLKHIDLVASSTFYFCMRGGKFSCICQVSFGKDKVQDKKKTTEK